MPAAARPERAPDAALEALGGRSRREILALLAAQNRSVQQIAEQLPISRPAVSRHLRVLKDAGLVAEEAVGTRRIYHLEPRARCGARLPGTGLGRGGGRGFGCWPRTRRGVTMPEPLRLDVVVACPPDHAFDVWANRIDAWWPRDHTATGEPGARVVLEARSVAGSTRLPPTAPSTSGARSPPGSRRAGWPTSGTCGPTATPRPTSRSGSSPDDAGTRVEIEHAGWERLGDAADAWRERNLGGWTTLLPHFVAATTAP